MAFSDFIKYVGLGGIFCKPCNLDGTNSKCAGSLDKIINALPASENEAKFATILILLGAATTYFAFMLCSGPVYAACYAAEDYFYSPPNKSNKYHCKNAPTNLTEIRNSNAFNATKVNNKSH